MAGVRVGRNVRCVSSASFFLNGPLSIGSDTWVGHEVLIVGGDAPVGIGESCDIAPRVLIATGSHVIERHGPRVAGEGLSLPITIGNGCWICAGATILGGTTIGDCCIVAAGAVVRGHFSSRSIIGGVPARKLGDLSEEQVSSRPEHFEQMGACGNRPFF
ncbi:MAG: acyltransferase [Betaproteobacteria bacterium]|nr:acyltransferase [Betaproteobacteria bacterium]